jgi:hypothetical protein
MRELKVEEMGLVSGGGKDGGRCDPPKHKHHDRDHYKHPKHPKHDHKGPKWCKD